MNEVRIELSIKNAALWRAIFQTHNSVAAFCREHGFSQSQIGAFLTLRKSPYSARRPLWPGEEAVQTDPLIPVARKLCDLFGISAEELFPLAIYSTVVMNNRKMTAEVHSSKFVGLGAARTLALPPAQNDKYEAIELRKLVESALGVLTNREQIVVRMRFGLAPYEGEEHTLEEVAETIQVSRARAAAIQATAIRKLRRPSNKSLKAMGSFLDTVPGGMDI